MIATRTSAPRAAVLALVLALVRLADAQPASPAHDDRAKAAEAAALYDEGKRHFDIGEYAQAIESWKQSYLLSSAPLLLFNIAQAYRLSGNCAQANRFYLNYRRDEKHPKNQTELDKAMARCAGIEPATGDAAGEPPASPAAGAAPSPPSTALAAGGGPGAAATAPAPARAGAASAATSSDTAASAPAAAPPASPAASIAASPAPGHSLRVTGIATGAVGVVALAAGGLYALAAKRDSDTVASSPTGTRYTGDLAATARSGKTAASRAQDLLGVGVALAVAGSVMWNIGHRQGAQVDAAIAPGHAEVAVSCAF
jgi:tetratricopeptide (TPR) repeat protein